MSRTGLGGCWCSLARCCTKFPPGLEAFCHHGNNGDFITLGSHSISCDPTGSLAVIMPYHSKATRALRLSGYCTFLAKRFFFWLFLFEVEVWVMDEGAPGLS
ncbi:hypothetical protein Nepgr_021822 [Nepenthes gracilis]|uniref:Uncharacterized protein n=1 Tax=Nepenthes gracilis TaxID=150966 RepID=A0AAD3XXS0_NEPGR|nr:hypothetical protein Nepgr_021822 [Nepenthes gracilis]